MTIKRDINGREGLEKDIDTSWLSRYGPEAARLGLTPEEMLMCNQIGVTPAQFAAGKAMREAGEAVMNGKPRPAAPRPTPAKVQPLTKEQLLLCKQLEITPEQFLATAAGLRAAGEIV